MTKKWICPENRKWTPSAAEKKFFELLHSGGFSVVSLREYISKTELQIQKDGTEVEYAFDKESRAQKTYECFLRYFDISVKYAHLKNELEQAKKEA